MIGRRSLLLALLCGSMVEVNAAPSTIWAGNSGGYRWIWTNRDVTATAFSGGAPKVSLRKLLKTQPLYDVQTSLERRVTVLSVVGPLVSVEVADFWTGGAHPSGAIWHQSFDARHPTRVATLTDYIPYAQLRKPLFADRVVGSILKEKGLKAAPSTRAQLESLLSSEEFEVDETPYRFSKHPLSQFSFHHLEGGQVAIRLNVSWSIEAARGHTTQIGLLAPIPAALKNRFAAAASGKEGFLRRTGAARFKDKSATLFEWSKP